MVNSHSFSFSTWDWNCRKAILAEMSSYITFLLHNKNSGFMWGINVTRQRIRCPASLAGRYGNVKCKQTLLGRTSWTAFVKGGNKWCGPFCPSHFLPLVCNAHLILETPRAIFGPKATLVIYAKCQAIDQKSRIWNHSKCLPGLDCLHSEQKTNPC